MTVRSRITDTPIDPGEALAQVGDPEHGAAILFLGTVRRRNEGRIVRGMRYDAYIAMAEEVLRTIARETADAAASEQVSLVHRVGELAIGEVSVAIAVSSPHRAQAFAAARHAIEEIKRRLPVWKQEHYVEGDAAWLDGAVPPVPEVAGE
jgi:molybdopterin synthase catalytic subunit